MQSEEQKRWEKYECQMNGPGLISILKYNQIQQDKIPDTHKKSMAEHLRKKALNRFNIENKGVLPKQRKENLERRNRIAMQVDQQMEDEFLKPSMD
eukprot:CAMPEP_0205812206 /NCGR_PEP_ID=MMETSP0205-20121125/16583_1 /ASSEMBLY_ACC=CAM_ASM_000278 /TAXON_ID=36767 /ORGANISM="Euplotes focardii, Strain TN1" /LENGTH=95 /DNA_ID=CAMNT_0053092499 /DNA_START=202 /DNA_END=486 /DNA_ORIENTATION=-